MSRIRANQITNQSADGAPTVQNGLIISGVCTATSFVGSGANLTSLPSQVTITGNSDNRVITGGSGTNLVGEQRLTYSGSELTNANVTSNEDSAINIYKATGDNADKAILRVGYNETNSFKLWRPRADGNIYMETSQSSSDIIINTNNGSAIGERLRIASDGQITQTAASGDTVITLKRSDTNTTGLTGGINFAASDGHSVASVQARGDGDNEGAHLQFYTTTAAAGDMFNAANVERLRITSAGDVAIGRDTALNNYAAGSTTTQLAVVKDGGAAGSGYHEVAHFTGGNDSNDTGAIVRITQFNNDRGLYIKGGRGTGDQAKAIFGLRNSANSDSDVMVFHQGGNVETPSQPSFFVNGSPSVGANTGYSNIAYSFSNVQHNTGSHYANATGRFTAPITGRYFFTGGLWCNTSDNNSGAYLLVFKKNGSEAGVGCNHRFSGNQLQATMIINLAANDIITLGFADGSGGSIQASTPRNYFCGYLVG